MKQFSCLSFFVALVLLFSAGCEKGEKNFKIFKLSPEEQKVVVVKDEETGIRAEFNFSTGSVDNTVDIVVAVGKTHRIIPPYKILPFYVYLDFVSGGGPVFKKGVSITVYFPEGSTYPEIAQGFIGVMEGSDTSSSVYSFMPGEEVTRNLKFSTFTGGTFIPAYSEELGPIKSYGGLIDKCSEEGWIILSGNEKIYVENYPYSLSTQGIFISQILDSASSFPCGATQRVKLIYPLPVSIEYPVLYHLSSEALSAYWFPDKISNTLLQELSRIFQNLIDSGLFFPLITIKGGEYACSGLEDVSMNIAMLNLFHTSGGVTKILLNLSNSLASCESTPDYGELISGVSNLITLMKENFRITPPEGFDCSADDDCLYYDGVCASDSSYGTEFSRNITCSGCRCSCYEDWCELSIVNEFDYKSIK